MERKALLGEYTAKSVLSDGLLAASQEEEKTKSGSTTTATRSPCKLCSRNRNFLEKNSGHSMQRFYTICGPAASFDTRGSLLKCDFSFSFLFGADTLKKFVSSWPNYKYNLH